jgi:hypothetical protein
MCPINLRALSMYTNTNKLLMRIFTQILTWYSPFQKTLKKQWNIISVHPKGKISDIQLKFKEPNGIDNKIRIQVRHGRNASF